MMNNMMNSMFPARYEFKKDEATGTTALSPVQLMSTNNPYGRDVPMQIMAYKNEEKDRNTKQTTISSATYTDRKERVIDPVTRLPNGKAVVGQEVVDPSIPNQLTDCTPVDGTVPDTCANPLSTLLLKEGVAVLRPTFGLNRYNETKNMYV